MGKAAIYVGYTGATFDRKQHFSNLRIRDHKIESSLYRLCISIRRQDLPSFFYFCHGQDKLFSSFYYYSHESTSGNELNLLCVCYLPTIHTSS